MLLISLQYFPITLFCCWDRNVLIVIDVLIIHCRSHCTAWFRNGRVHISPVQCYTIITNRTLLYEELQAEFVNIHQHLDTMECKVQGLTYIIFWTRVTIFALCLMSENSILQNLLKTDKYHDQPYSFEYNYITLVLRVNAIMFIKYLG